MPKPIKTLEDVQGTAQTVYICVSQAIVPLNLNVNIATLAECVRTLATLCMEQRAEIDALKVALAASNADKPAVMRMRETKEGKPPPGPENKRA